MKKNVLVLFAVLVTLPFGAIAAEKKMKNVRVLMPTGVPAISMAEMIKGESFQMPGYAVDYQVLE